MKDARSDRVVGRQAGRPLGTAWGVARAFAVLGWCFGVFLTFFATGHTVPMPVVLAGRWILGGMIVIHALEIPVGIRCTTGCGIPAGRAATATLIFGFTWWLPVSRMCAQRIEREHA